MCHRPKPDPDPHSTKPPPVQRPRPGTGLGAERGNEALKIVKLVILITDTLSLKVVISLAGEFEGPVLNRRRRSDHIPLRRRCVFGGSGLPHTKRPSLAGQKGRCRRLADQQCREGAGEADQQDARSYYYDQID
jgi:hypothetical protein